MVKPYFDNVVCNKPKRVIMTNEVTESTSKMPMSKAITPRHGDKFSVIDLFRSPHIEETVKDLEILFKHLKNPPSSETNNTL
jgi:hypothetical protein